MKYKLVAEVMSVKNDVLKTYETHPISFDPGETMEDVKYQLFVRAAEGHTFQFEDKNGTVYLSKGSEKFHIKIQEVIN